MSEIITDKFINEDLYITKEEHEDILKHTGAALYCRKDLLNEIEFTPDAVCAYWQGKPIHCHHRNGKYASVEQLILDDAYYDLDASELVILPGYEHMEVHHLSNNIADDIIKMVIKLLVAKARKPSKKHVENLILCYCITIQ